jgi:hypothetical protein
MHLSEGKKSSDIAPAAELTLIKSLGGTTKKGDLSDEILTKIINGDYKDVELPAGSKNTYSKQKKWNFKDISNAKTKEEALIITTAGTVKKVRGKYERICQLNVSGTTTPNDSYLGQLSTLYKVAKLSGVTIKNKVAAGISYEKMQVDNLDAWMKTYLSNHVALPLLVDGKEMNVKIDGGAKIGGSPKADIGLGIGGNSNFWISYKHGEYKDDSGKTLKASFQQYGSVKTFYDKEFNSAVESKVGSQVDSFLSAVASQIKSDGYYFPGCTGIKELQSGQHVIMQGEKETLSPTENKKLWAVNFTRVNNVVKQVGKTNLYILDISGWSKRRSILNLGSVGQDIAMLSIFGTDYPSGKPGVNNVNVLLQDHTAMNVGFAVNSDGEATHVDISVSNKGHIMFNPKIYGSAVKFPSFASFYEPYFLARYTGEQNIGFNGGKDFMIGVRLLVMPASQTKDGSDI